MLRPGPGRGCGASPWQKRGCQVRHWEGPELPREPDGLALTAALDTGPLALDRKAQSQQASPSGPAGGSSEGEEALPSNLGCTFPAIPAGAQASTALKALQRQHRRQHRCQHRASVGHPPAWSRPFRPLLLPLLFPASPVLPLNLILQQRLRLLPCSIRDVRRMTPGVARGAYPGAGVRIRVFKQHTHARGLLILRYGGRE